MMMPAIFSSLEFALSHQPELLRQAVRDDFKLGQRLPPNLNWDLLGDTAHNRGALGFRDHQTNTGELWTRLAIEVYDRLAAGGEGNSRHDDYCRSSMFSRANLINQLGLDESDPQRSLAMIERWFFAVLPMPLADLQTLYHAAEEDDIRAMDIVSGFKANLAVIKLLRGKKWPFTREAEIREMLEFDAGCAVG